MKIYIYYIEIIDNKWNQMYKNMRNNAKLSLQNLENRIEYINLLLLHYEVFIEVY